MPLRAHLAAGAYS